MSSQISAQGNDWGHPVAEYKGVLVFPQGISYIERGAPRNVRWDDISQVWQSTYDVIMGLGTIQHCAIQLNDGSKHTFAFSGELTNILQQECTRRILPRLQEAYNAGETVSFDELGISKAGIRKGKNVLSWDHVERINVERGYINIFKHGSVWRTWTIAVASVPNFFAFASIVGTIMRELFTKRLTAPQTISAMLLLGEAGKDADKLIALGKSVLPPTTDQPVAATSSQMPEIMGKPESLTPSETITGSAPVGQDVTRKSGPESRDALQSPEPPSAAQTFQSSTPRAKRKAGVIIMGAIALIAICILLPICLIVGMMLLNPVMSNTFSGISAGLNPLQPKPEINTSAGALVIAKTEFANSLPPGCSSGPTCNKPKNAGNQILILWLERKDGGKMEEIRDKLFSEVTKNLGKAYVTTSDGYKAELTVAQFVEPRFALGFVLPISATRGIKLTWPDNPVIDLGNPLAISPANAKTPISTIKPATPVVIQKVITSTPLTSPSVLPAGAVRPQPGYWEGTSGVSFDVIADGTLHNFRLAASDVQCTLRIDEVSVKPNGTFELIELIEESKYWPGTSRDEWKAKNLWPTPVMTEKGAMIEAQRINGKFVNATSMSGSYKVLVCGNQQVMPGQRSEPLTFGAQWKGTTQAPTQISTPVVPTARPVRSATPDEILTIVAGLPKGFITTTPPAAFTPAATPTVRAMLPTASPSPRPPTVTPTITATPAPGVNCDNPNARIVSPAMNETVRGVVPFMGAASVPDFLYYKIQFMPDSSYGTGKWGELYQGKTAVPPNGKLIDWHTYTVEPGGYWMRLIVADRTGNYPDPCEIRVQVAR